MEEEIREVPSRLQYLKQRIQPALEEPIRTHIIVGTVALGVGVGVGYILGKRNKYEALVEVEDVEDRHEDPNQMRIEFDSEELAEELAEIREYVEGVREKRLRAEALQDEDGDIRPGLVIEEEVVSEDLEGLILDREDKSVKEFVEHRLKEAMTTSHGSLDPDEDEPEAVSIFTGTSDWDKEAEEAKRSVHEPYVLHQDEFFSDEKGYMQHTLTYFAGDNILVDEEEAPIYNHEQVTGPLRFGVGSNDPNVVYIRNDKRRAEYEVLHHEGLFSEEVLGLDIQNNQRVRDNPRDREIRHSERKFRQTE